MSCYSRSDNTYHFFDPKKQKKKQKISPQKKNIKFRKQSIYWLYRKLKTIFDPSNVK